MVVYHAVKLSQSENSNMVESEKNYVVRAYLQCHLVSIVEAMITVFIGK